MAGQKRAQASERMSIGQAFTAVATRAANLSGRAITFLAAVLVVIVWAVTGPYFAYSNTWQLVINTGTTIITFLMVFLIQNSQNRDSAAIQVKLDELIRSSAAKNAFVGIEHLTVDEIEELRSLCERRAKGVAEAGKQREAHVRRRATRAADRASGLEGSDE